MDTTADPTGPTWAQFRSQHPSWGNPGNKKHRKESHKARQKRLKGTSNNKQKHKIKHNTRPPTYTHYDQLDLTGHNISRHDSEAYGDLMKTKPSETTRIALHNIQLLPENSKHYKSRLLIDHIYQAQLDCLLLNEVGLNWRALSSHDQWAERTFGKLKGSQALFSHNTTEPEHTDTIQYGGVGIVTNQDLSSRIISTGQDFSNLGRWA